MAGVKGRSGNKNAIPPKGGRKPGVPNKLGRGIGHTLLSVWTHLQDQKPKNAEAKKTALLDLAMDDPKWFYELMKGSFPKDLNILLEGDAALRVFLEKYDDRSEV